MEKKRVLIIDDEKSFTQMVKLNLEETGKYIVRAENDGAKAIEAAREFNPHIIFLDIVMPDVDGGEIAQKLRADTNLAKIPVVFLTAIVKENEVDSQDGIIGGNPFIAKPVTTQKITDAIEKYTQGVDRQ